MCGAERLECGCEGAVYSRASRARHVLATCHRSLLLLCRARLNGATCDQAAGAGAKEWRLNEQMVTQPIGNLLSGTSVAQVNYSPGSYEQFAEIIWTMRRDRTNNSPRSHMIVRFRIASRSRGSRRAARRDRRARPAREGAIVPLILT